MATVAVVALLLLAGCSAGYQSVSEPPEPSEPPSDGHLGFYDGYWYNDTFDVNAADGLTDEELEAVIARSMARVQLLRGLAFEADVEVELLTRSAFREEFDDVGWGEPTEDARTVDNVQHEALLLVGSDRDVVDVRRANRGDIVLGFYQPSTERLVVVSEHDPATLDDEITLAHELLHALQDQHFDLASIHGQPTLDGVNARNGLVEGDAVLIEREYEQRCESGEWECVVVGEGHQPAEPSEEFHFGVYFVGFFPYAEGPSFVDHHRDRDGWRAIDEMYDALPITSAEVVHPETYGTDAYGEATLSDRSTVAWERVERDDGPVHATVGQAGLTSMFAYTAYADQRSGVVEREAFENVVDDRLDRLRPFTYDVSPAEGWYADRLNVYERGDETAFVWNVTFQDSANASEFFDAYEETVGFWDGEPVETGGGASIWTFDESDRFEGAVWMNRDSRSVTVVKAPTVEALGDVYAPAEARTAVAESSAVGSTTGSTGGPIAGPTTHATGGPTAPA